MVAAIVEGDEMELRNEVQLFSYFEKCDCIAPTIF